MANLPENWIKINLPELCNITTGKWDANHSNPNGKYRFYTCSSEYSFSETASFNGKSIIVPGNGDIGLVFFYDGEFEAYQRTYVLNNIKINPLFLFYHFKFAWRSHNSDKQFGSTVKYVRMGNFENYEIPLPPLAEQGRIVQKIEELFADIDAGIQNLKSVQNQIKLYRQSVLKSAFDFEEKYFSCLNDFIEKPRYGTSKKCSSECKNNDIPVYRIPNINFYQGIIDKTDLKFASFDDNEKKSLALEKGDILLIRSNGSPNLVGRCALINDDDINGLFAGYLIRLRIKNKKELLPEFVLRFFNSGKARAYIEKKAKSTSGVNNINSEEISELQIPVPTLDEQKRIVAEIERRFERADELEKAVNAALADAEKLKQSVLKKAFRGELVPQNPDDEPAAVLLDRIRAERAAAPKSPKKGKRK